MKTLRTSIAALIPLLLNFATPAFAQETEQTNLAFTEKSVLVFCPAPKFVSEVSQEIFLDTFPKLISSMRQNADKGELSRLHFLGHLKGGFFMVVNGETSEIAQAKADKLLAQNDAIVAEDLKSVDVGVDTKNVFSKNCGRYEVGPAIIPAKG